jgi:hypothetical protein
MLKRFPRRFNLSSMMKFLILKIEFLMLKLSVTKFIFVLYLLLFILSNLDLNDFFFNINQVSLDV